MNQHILGMLEDTFMLDTVHLFPLKGLDTFVSSFAIVYKEDNFYNFLCWFLHTMPLSVQKRKAFAPKGTDTFV